MIDWQNIDTVLFDMDGTLLDLHYDNYFWLQHLPQRYAQLHGITQNEAYTLLMGKIMAQHGRLNFYCIDYWSDQLDVDIAAMKIEVQNRICFLPHALQLLTTLKRLPIKTMIVTNAHRKTLAIKDTVVNVSAHVDSVCASHDLGLPKEDPGFWPEFAKHYPFDPDKTVFIDDNEAVLASAAQFNIKHLIMPLNPDSQKPSQNIKDPDRYRGIESLDELNPL